MKDKTMTSVKVELTKPIELHGKRLTEIELREPTGGLYVKHGEPRTLVFNSSGSGYWVAQQEVIKAYLEALIVHDLGGDLVNLMSLEDVMATQEALYSFFSDAAERVAARKSTLSSSALAS
jgi:hypothetical protein